MVIFLCENKINRIGRIWIDFVLNLVVKELVKVGLFEL